MKEDSRLYYHGAGMLEEEKCKMMTYLVRWYQGYASDSILRAFTIWKKNSMLIKVNREREMKQGAKKEALQHLLLSSQGTRNEEELNAVKNYLLTYNLAPPSLPPEKMDRIAQQIQYRELCDGDVLFWQGQQGEEYYILLEGYLQLFSVDGQEGQKKLRDKLISRAANNLDLDFKNLEHLAGNSYLKLREGCGVGELSLLTGKQRNVTAVCDGPVKLAVVPQTTYRSCYRQWHTETLNIAGILDLLKDNGHFDDWAPFHLSQLACNMSKCELHPNQKIIEQGKPLQYVYMICKGQVALSFAPAKSFGDDVVQLGTVSHGTLIADMEVVKGEPLHQFTACTMSFVTALKIPCNLFKYYFLDLYPSTANWVTTSADVIVSRMKQNAKRHKARGLKLQQISVGSGKGFSQFSSKRSSVRMLGKSPSNTKLNTSTLNFNVRNYTDDESNCNSTINSPYSSAPTPYFGSSENFFDSRRGSTHSLHSVESWQQGPKPGFITDQNCSTTPTKPFVHETPPTTIEVPLLPLLDITSSPSPDKQKKALKKCESMGAVAIQQDKSNLIGTEETSTLIADLAKTARERRDLNIRKTHRERHTSRKSISSADSLSSRDSIVSLNGPVGIPRRRMSSLGGVSKYGLPKVARSWSPDNEYLSTSRRSSIEPQSAGKRAASPGRPIPCPLSDPNNQRSRYSSENSCFSGSDTESGAPPQATLHRCSSAPENESFGLTARRVSSIVLSPLHENGQESKLFTFKDAFPDDVPLIHVDNNDRQSVNYSADAPKYRCLSASKQLRSSLSMPDFKKKSITEVSPSTTIEEALALGNILKNDFKVDEMLWAKRKGKY